ncbi:hypothetical protein [Amycolatopsis sp. NPDC051071]|uniref:hypothetical protein n=1 Tax=Amycolatopsis sp. NPDC051071 TaxID=3154637 RepID=UPI00341236B6
MSSNLTGGTNNYPTSSSSPLGWNFLGIHGLGDPLRRLSDLGQLVCWELDRHCRTLTVVVNHDRELDRLEEGLEVLLRRFDQVHRQAR